MGLCYVCKGIPFEQPPSLPPAYLKNLPGQPYDPVNSTIFFVESSDASHDPPPYGYVHWQSESDLARSARSCSLCRLIHDEFIKNTNGQQPTGNCGFFITRREKDQSGFVVWTQGDRPLVIWRVGAFGYSVDNVNDPLAHVFRGRKIYEHSNGPKARKVAKQWLDDCVQNHDLCGPPGSAAPHLPTRVLDLGRTPTSGIKLWETKGARHNYTTLSYTWGPESLGQTYKMTQANIQRYKQGINLQADGIPPTIVDAIDITQNMGIQYLWVDALCIIQGDSADFHQEGPKMMDYYGNSYLTITAAAAADVYQGVFNDRVPPNDASFSYTSRSGVPGTLIITALDPYKENLQPDYLSFEGNPIITRAWTLQERILSTRNLFYANDQMYYECNEHFVSEDGLLVHGRRLSTNPKTRELSLFPKLNENLRRRWDLLLQEYGGRKMRDPQKDKFVAISGLARRFGRLFGGDHYLAGLWKHVLIQHLFWTTNTVVNPDARSVWHPDWPPAPSNYRAPSWSWASMDMPILNPDGRIYLAELYATHVNSTIALVQADDYSQITYADITINAPMLHILYLRGYMQQGLQAHNWARYDDPSGATISVLFSTVFDYEFQPSQLQTLDVYALVLGRDTSLSQDGINDVNYLCLLVTEAEGDMTYRRMGIVWLEENRMGNQAIRYLDTSDYMEILLV